MEAEDEANAVKELWGSLRLKMQQSDALCGIWILIKTIKYEVTGNVNIHRYLIISIIANFQV